jgi:hypothetical protein
MATQRRRKTQAGQEIFEFALAMVWIFVPLFIGTFIVGMNLIRSIQANQVCRDLDDMYIHGADFSTYPIQQEGQRLAQGLNLQISAFAGDANGHEQANTGNNSGSGLVTLTKVMWIGGPAAGECQSVAPANCTNQNSFVFIQQIQFGNANLETAQTVTVGECPSAIMNSSGVVTTNYITDARATLGGSAQTNLQALWQSNGEVQNGTATPLSDGQVVYIAESYFASPGGINGYVGMPSSTNPGYTDTGVYARYFF